MKRSKSLKITPSENAESARQKKDNFLIVGIGASAGGIQALQEFFEHVPPDSGIAYVVILHLSPKHESHLSDVLQTVSKIPVTQVTEKVRVKPDHVYVVPPNKHLTMKEDHVIVSKNTVIEDRRAPVDIFFRTLAETHGNMAVAVVLSGTGANGSMGIKRVKENGGATFVQNPREAEFNEMPRNSIATELVDDVLPVAEIPQKIIAYKARLGEINISEKADERAQEQQQALRSIFTQIRIRTGHDFSNYKRPTLLRRIQRRISVHSLADLPAYATFIHEHPEETQALLKDLLISVTNFFRDKKAFNVIEREILPHIFHEKTSEDQVRIWVVGCATGEEAYSMAILCAERTLGVIDAPKVQIFATDIDQHAIAVAREGLYSLNDAADVSPERLRRFFIKEGEEYRIRREIREMVMFAHHNVIKDPPFSRLGLISCRNMMIYLNSPAQERIMETFHFALNPGSYLFLGTSESVDGANDLFTPVNREHRIFQSRPVAARPFPVPESVPVYQAEQPKQPRQPNVQSDWKRPQERISYGDLHGQLLEQYAPPSIVVNEEYDIVHLSEQAGRYLQMSGGELSNNLIKLIRPELRLGLRSALCQAAQRRTNVEAPNLKIALKDHPERINIHIRPVFHEDDPAQGFILILLEPVSGKKGHDEDTVLTSESPVNRHLEEELTRLKTQLRTSNEQHEVQAEELKASNEELQALNEELRSSAEELETSKEELQSINEELTTVNQELKVKIEELSISSNNLQNLINSADIATIFLDRSFRINLFTPAAREIFNLIPGDQGRPIADITHHLESKNLLENAETVLEKLQPVEQEVRTTDKRHFLMRILPYRTAEDLINGVVITFVDITSRKRWEEAVRESEERLRIILDAAKMGAWDLNVAAQTMIWNKYQYILLGLEAAKEQNNTQELSYFLQFIHPEDVENVREKLAAAIEEDAVFQAQFRIIQANDGEKRWMTGYGRKIKSEEGRPARLVGVMYDITERKVMERQKDEFIGIASHELKTPVTSIKMYVEVIRQMLEENKDEGENAELMEKLDKQVDRLMELINDLLDTTKIEEGRLSLNPTQFNMNELIEETIESFRPSSKKHQIIFNAEELPLITADRERIGQVISNFISNAIKYSPNGGEVTIASQKMEKEVKISVRDEGIGITDELKPEIFYRFSRVNNPQTFPGIGLGLYISAEIIRRHGGTISLESPPGGQGKGALFYFTLPVG